MHYFPRSHALVLVGALLLLAATAYGAPHPPLFPVQLGNYWILQSSYGDQKIIRCEPGTNHLLLVTGLSERPVEFYGAPKSTRLSRWDTLKRKLRPVVNLLPRRKGQSLFSAGTHPCDQLGVELDPVAESIQTPAGKYTGCSTLWIITVNPKIPGVCDLLSERIFFAPGVGPVMVQGRLDRLYLLVKAQVGDLLIGGQ